jgi:hypothetical protein
MLAQRSIQHCFILEKVYQDGIQGLLQWRQLFPRAMFRSPRSTDPTAEN